LPSNWEHLLVRDPLYGFIGLSAEEEKLLDTAAMQRLSRIKQLSHTYIVYPSAVHTRFEHSLGSLYIAGRICQELELPEERKRLIRMAGLLHDIGHGPFSHLFEEPMSWINGDEYSHDTATKLIIEHDPQISGILGSSKQELLDIFNGDSLESDIISGSLDVDKMDYLRRDSHHTGVAYGIFDLERVIRTLCSFKEDGREYIAIGEKGMDALESYRVARYAMHMQVYEHHARLIADDMFLKAVKAAFKEGCLAKENFNISANPSGFCAHFLRFDDSSIQHEMLQKSKGNAKKLIEDIRKRKLLKRALDVSLTDTGVPNPIRRDKISSMSRKEIENAENKIASELKIEPDYVVVHLQSVKIKLYERFEQTIGKKDKPILIKRRDGSITSIDQVSPISASLDPIRRLYVFCPEEHISAARTAAEVFFKVKSTI